MTTTQDKTSRPDAQASVAEPQPQPVLVDIGIPTYRRTTYLEEAIESVLGQTLDRWRLTISDNGSGGGDVERAIQPYLSDPRISYMASGRELTLARNWTRAINHGTAPYVALLNDDDRWHADFLRARVEGLETYPECGFAFSECLLVDETGALINYAPPRFPEGVVSRETLAQWFVRMNIVGVTTVVFRRSACESVGAAFEDTWHYCDWEMWARMGARFPAYYLARYDNDYRRHAHANTFAKREKPDRLIAMIAHMERGFARELPTFRLSRLQRMRNRSRILLRAAGEVHIGGGWKRSHALYLRALREYPPSLFEYRSLQMLGHSLIGPRGSRAVANAVRFAGRGLMSTFRDA
jgi:glycosyltransferase involved in cell wall biosynthesis